MGRDLVAERVPRGTLALLDAYVGCLQAEMAGQNLVSASTFDRVWDRHILDSLQLLELGIKHGGWADIGSGAGLPGMVIAIASDRPMILIEPRKRRAEFLTRTAEALGIASRVQVFAQRSQAVRIDHPAIVTARAVAALEQIFAMAAGYSSRATQWILPKGRSASEEVAIARQTWQGEFRLVESITEPGAMIVVAQDVRRRGQA